MSHLSVVDLEEVGYERWFEVGPTPTDVRAAVERLQGRRDRPGQHPFWLVALDGDAVVRGRVAGYVLENQQLTLWSPRLADDRLEGAAGVMAALVDSCWRRAAARTDIRLAECRPGHDSPHLSLVTDALRDAGFEEVACAHEFAREKPGTTRRVPDAGVSMLPYARLPDGTLERMISATQAVTADRAQAVNRLDLDLVVRELERTAGPHSVASLWHVASVRDMPVGYVLGSWDAGASQGHVLEIGVIPEARRAGVAHRLLDVVVSALERSGARCVTALIDDENAPSLALFRSAGFVARPGAYWTWQRHLR